MSIMVSRRGQHRAPRTSRMLTAERARGRTRAGVVAAAMLVSLFVAGPAHATPALLLLDTFPTETELGDTNIPFTLTVRNISDAGDEGRTYELQRVRMTPACDNLVGTECDADDAQTDVFDLAPTPVGAAGTTCAGVAFTVDEGPNGRHTLTPQSQVLLGPASGPEVDRTCTINWQIDEVTGVPTFDRNPAMDGVQTNWGADAQAEDVVNPGTTAFGGNTRDVTLHPGQVNLATVSDPNMDAGTSPIAPGQDSTDTATVTRADPNTNPDPTGTVTFELIGPDPDATCTGPSAFGPQSVAIDPGTGQATSSSSGPLNDRGLYNWVATFESGDNNYADITVAIGCGDPLEMFQVQPPPTIDVVKTADPLQQPAPTGTFTFDVEVTNTGVNPVTITALTDDIYGDLDDAANPNVANNTCAGAVGTALAPGATFTCAFDGDFTGNPGDQQTDVVTATAVDEFGQQAQADDDATVALVLPAPPVIAVDKTASPTELPVPGGEFTFTLTVTNRGDQPVTITSLVDDVHGDLDGQGTCAVGATLAADGGTYTCEFTVTFTGDAGDSETDVITVVAEDEEGRQATDEDDAVITIVPAEEVAAVPPSPPPPTPTRALPVTGLDLMPLVAVAGALLTVGVVLLAKTPAPGRHTSRGPPPPHRRRRPRLLRWAQG
ncbi:MAG: hypothetical protein WD080_12280 [Egibacteraceae bacterium]